MAQFKNGELPAINADVLNNDIQEIANEIVDQGKTYVDTQSENEKADGSKPLVVEVRADDPSSGLVIGRIWYNTSAKSLRICTQFGTRAFVLLDAPE